MEGPAQELVTAWTTQGVRFRAGAAPRALDQFQARFDVTLPEDLRAYFLLADGMEEGETDRELISFWSVSRLEPEDVFLDVAQRADSSGRYFVFADFLIHSHFYAILLTTDRGGENPVIWTGGEGYRSLLANSFTEFVQMYCQRRAGEFASAIIDPSEQRCH